MSENFNIKKIQADVNKMISTALQLKAENERLKVENAALKAEIEQLNATDM